jgi:adenine-specific DNA-methyltransferase
MRNAFKYLIQNRLTTPREVDRLIISAFLKINKLQTKYNTFLQTYSIDKSDKEEYERLIEFVSFIDSDVVHFGFEELIELFEFVISPADRIINGAIYTPENIRKSIVKETLNKQTVITDLFKISDIACGCGGFLFNASIELKKKINKSYSDIFSNHIYGLDIQEYSINRTKLLLTLLALSEGEDVDSFNFNLYTGDALSFNWKNQTPYFNGFDIVIGNPPYVCSRNIPEDSKKLLDNWKVCKSGHPDLYIPFFQIGIENLTSNGILGYITMNTFFKSVNGRALREYFQENQFSFKIIDFGNNQIFKSKSTYTCICLIENSKSSVIEYARSNKKLNNVIFNKIKYSKLDAFKGWNLNKNEIIDRIEDTGVSFGELYKTRNGIATLKNNIYIFNPIDENNDYYYLQNGKVYEIEKDICRDIINPNKFTQAESVDSIKVKAIFPYEYVNNRAILLDEKYIKINYPKAYKYLTDKKKILGTRDKGNGKYQSWYAYGRNQSLEKLKYKLFFPHITPSTPNFTIDTDENLLFYNGLAVITENEKELHFLKKLMTSRLFWTYIELSSKPYGSGYYSLSRNYIKNFGVYNFDDKEKDFIINTNEQKEIDTFIESKYGIKLETK